MGFVYVAVPFLLRLEILPSSPGSGITALQKGTLKVLFQVLGQEIRWMWEKRASFRDDETASCGVLANLYLK